MNAGVSAALPGRVFLALAGAFGLFFALATPAHDPPDESRHHGRAWLVSGGWLRVVGEAPGHAASVPWDIAHLHPRGHHYTDDAYHVRRVFGAARRAPAHAPAEMWSRLGGRLDRTQLQPVRILTPYAPYLYAPYLPGLWLARAADASAGAGLLLARLGGLAFWLTGIWLCLGIAPSQRWTLAAVALLPMSVFQAASVSGDPFTQVAVFWFIAEWLRSAEGGGRGRLLTAALAVGLVKPGYAPIASACLLLPGRWPRRVATTGAALALASVPALAWTPFLQAAKEPAMVEGADAIAQLGFVLADPLAFLSALADSTRFHLRAWLEGMIGYLGHFDVPIPPASTALALAALAASASLDRGAFGWATRAGLLGVFGLTSLALLVLAYAGWSPVGADKILGFQGRYLLPILPLALLAVPRLPRLPEPLLARAVVGSLGLVLAVSAASMLRAYYTEG
jgi:hypothetical protein